MFAGEADICAMVSALVHESVSRGDARGLPEQGQCGSAGVQGERGPVWQPSECADCLAEASLVVDDEHGVGWVGGDARV
jgi:hypothetical protein